MANNPEIFQRIKEVTSNDITAWFKVEGQLHRCEKHRNTVAK